MRKVKFLNLSKNFLQFFDIHLQLFIFEQSSLWCHNLKIWCDFFLAQVFPEIDHVINVVS